MESIQGYWLIHSLTDSTNINRAPAGGRPVLGTVQRVVHYSYSLIREARVQALCSDSHPSALSNRLNCRLAMWSLGSPPGGRVL